MPHESINDASSNQDNSDILRETVPIILQCMVPSCNSNTQNCPGKKFFPLPTNPIHRKIWLMRANIEIYVTTDPSVLVFCQDHFDGCSIPSRFECQYFSDFSDSHHAPPLQGRHSLAYGHHTFDNQYRFQKRNPVKSKKVFILSKSHANGCKTWMHGSSFKLDLKPTSSQSTPLDIIKQKIKDLDPANGIHFLALVIEIEHAYAKILPEKEHIKHSREDSFKIKEKFLLVNKKNRIYMQTQRNIELNEETDSADSICTFKCDHCGIEYIHNIELQDHIKQNHITTEKGQKHFNVIKLNEKFDGILPFKCELCGIEYIHNTDLQIHMKQHLDIEEGLTKHLENIHEESGQHLEGFDEDIRGALDDYEEEPLQYCDDQDEPLDIKPEIFQCSKCPSSFVNEEDMSKHLQFMHGDLADLTRHIRKLKNNKQGHRKCIDSGNSLNNEKGCKSINEENEQQESVCQVNYSGCKFAEIETSVEIKRENVDSLDDVDFSMENQNLFEHNLDFDPMNHLVTFLNENSCATNLNLNTDVQIEYSELNGEELNPNETRDIKREYIDYKIAKSADDIATFEWSFIDFLFQQDIQNSHSVQQNSNSDLIICKKCLKTFLSQEELLNHLHELINTKAKLYADARRVLKADSVRFKTPYSRSQSGDKQFLNEAELLEYIHKVFNSKKKLCLQVVKYTSEEDNETTNPLFDQKVCRICSRPLPKTTIKRKYRDKICRWCKQTEIKKEKRRKSSKAKLYASAKNVQLKNCVDTDKTRGKAVATVLTSLSTLNEALESVSNIFNEPVKESQMDTDEVPSSSKENDLLKPIREEDEKVLVQPYDPTLCKSCLIPLDAKTTGNNAICKKCKKLEVSNENRRKSHEKRMSIENIMKTPYVLLHRLPDKYSDEKCCESNESADNNECHMCHLKFCNRFYLKEHAFRNHL